MGNSRTIFPRVELVSQRIERLWMFTEVGYIKDCFWIRQIEPSQVGVETSIG